MRQLWIMLITLTSTPLLRPHPMPSHIFRVPRQLRSIIGLRTLVGSVSKLEIQISCKTAMRQHR